MSNPFVHEQGYYTRTKLYKSELVSNNRTIVSNVCKKAFYAQDYEDFRIEEVEFEGVVRRMMHGRIATVDLNNNDIVNGDEVEYSNKRYTVIGVLYKDNNQQKAIRTRPNLKTIIELVGKI